MVPSTTQTGLLRSPASRLAPTWATTTPTLRAAPRGRRFRRPALRHRRRCRRLRALRRRHLPRRRRPCAGAKVHVSARLIQTPGTRTLRSCRSLQTAALALLLTNAAPGATMNAVCSHRQALRRRRPALCRRHRCHRRRRPSRRRRRCRRPLTLAMFWVVAIQVAHAPALMGLNRASLARAFPRASLQPAPLALMSANAETELKMNAV